MLTLNQEWEQFVAQTVDGVVDEREVAIAKFCFYAGITIMHKRMDELNSSKLSLKDKIMALKLTKEELLEWMDEQKDEPAIPDRITLL